MTLPPISGQITFLYTRDLKVTANFYEQIIGLKLWLDQGACRIYQVVEGALLGFCERPVVQNQRPDVIFTLVTPDVEGWHAALLARGVTFEHPPRINPKYNILHCFLRDPNGYLIEIQRFLA